MLHSCYNNFTILKFYFFVGCLSEVASSSLLLKVRDQVLYALLDGKLVRL